MNCPKCNHDNPPLTNKCLICDFDLKNLETDEVETKKLTSNGRSTLKSIQMCPGCGQPLSWDQKFCTKCGANLTNLNDEENNENTIKPDNSDLENQAFSTLKANDPDNQTYMQISVRTDTISPQVIGELSYRFSMNHNNRQYYCPDCSKKILKQDSEKDDLLELSIIDSQQMSHCMLCKQPLINQEQISQPQRVIDTVKSIPQQAMNAVKNHWNNPQSPSSNSPLKVCGFLCCCCIIISFIFPFLLF
jgi:hypothetical protein